MRRTKKRSAAVLSYSASKRKRASTWKPNVLPRSKLSASPRKEVADKKRLERAKQRYSTAAKARFEWQLNVGSRRKRKMKGAS
jgi:hypothetical protein